MADLDTKSHRTLPWHKQTSNVSLGTVYHYRDKSNLECDAVVHLENGSYGLIEIKLGGDTLIKEGAENL